MQWDAWPQELTRIGRDLKMTLKQLKESDLISPDTVATLNKQIVGIWEDIGGEDWLKEQLKKIMEAEVLGFKWSKDKSSISIQLQY